MKRLLLPIGCVLSLLLVPARGSLTARSTAGPPQEGAAAAQPTPQQEQEWDPKTQGIGDLTEGPRVEANRPKVPVPIVKRFFTPTEFAQYVKSEVVPALRKSKFKPGFIVLHNTAVPSIAQRPHGFTAQNMDDLAYYYGVTMRWPSGPHAFVDQNGIWVFTRLDRRGTHSPSWNGGSWGVEQLGDFTKEDYNSGEGAKIRDNAIAALAILYVAKGLPSKTLHFHRNDPNTTHKGCPGDTCYNNRADVIKALQREMEKWRKEWKSL